jgi:hypothetical protein
MPSKTFDTNPPGSVEACVICSAITKPIDRA